MLPQQPGERGPARVASGLQQIIDATQADELILVSDAYDAADRRASFRFIAESKRHAGGAQAAHPQ